MKGIRAVAGTAAAMVLPLRSPHGRDIVSHGERAWEMD